MFFILKVPNHMSQFHHLIPVPKVTAGGVTEPSGEVEYHVCETDQVEGVDEAWCTCSRFWLRWLDL